MDTSAVAELLGTTPRKLRIFLRSEQSTFAAVGSGARYEFTEADLPSLRNRWALHTGENPPIVEPVVTPEPRTGTRDRAVWDEEGPIVLPDIRDPRVRAEVRRVARDQEHRLELRLLAAGLHITQMAVKPSRRTK